MREFFEGIIAKQWPEVVRVWPCATMAPLHNRGVLVCVPGVKLREGAWNSQTATIWFVLPTAFPQASPANFYVRDLVLEHGGYPSHTTNCGPFPHAYAGWTECVNQPTRWDANTCTIATYIRVCQHWFEARLSAAA